MANQKQSAARLSLAQHFTPPEGYTGSFGWLCGYSADAAFMNDALERYTGQTFATRAQTGRIALALMLDPGNAAITAVEVPGLAHLLWRASSKPFVLLHAKVALLGFRHQEDASRWLLRLIVSTGNWTRETLEESLDLAWSVDVTLEDMDDPQRAADCADVNEAWDLLSWLRTHFDGRLLGLDRDDQARTPMQVEIAQADQTLHEQLALCKRRARGAAARFFDNRTRSLLAQLPKLVENANSGTRCNNILMGSGFYEPDPRNPNKLVPLQILEKLTEHQLLTASAWKALYVNPRACQGVAAAASTLENCGVEVHSARTPTAVFGKGAERTLHAKFIFSANSPRTGNQCTAGWIYLGSGNLSTAGFANRASSSGGNLEAGVVLGADRLYWKQESGVAPHLVVSNILPVHWEQEASLSLAPGEPMPERPQDTIAAPFAWFNWSAADVDSAQSVLVPSEPMSALEGVSVLTAQGTPCAQTATGYVWTDGPARQVRVRWTSDGTTHTALVPVVDEYGRIAATPLLPLELSDLWQQLATFPQPPDQDDENSEGEGWAAINGRDAGKRGARASGTAEYPLRKMMQHIELIAQRQTTIQPPDWTAWCNRLLQVFARAADSTGVKAFVALEVNPLGPLWAAPFRPEFAETAATYQGGQYESVLQSIEQAWGVAAFRKLGDAK